MGAGVYPSCHCFSETAVLTTKTPHCPPVKSFMLFILLLVMSFSACSHWFLNLFGIHFHRVRNHTLQNDAKKRFIVFLYCIKGSHKSLTGFLSSYKKVMTWLFLRQAAYLVFLVRQAEGYLSLFDGGMSCIKIVVLNAADMLLDQSMKYLLETGIWFGNGFSFKILNKLSVVTASHTITTPPPPSDLHQVSMIDPAISPLSPSRLSVFIFVPKTFDFVFVFQR